MNLWLERSGRRLSALPGLTAVSAAPASTALLGLLVAVVSWNVTFLPPSFGLDNSWSSGLFMAAQRGMHFGTQIVFTYGPLAFLRQPAMWYEGLGTLGFLYSAALQIGLAASLVWALRRTLSAPLAAVIAAAVLLAAPSHSVALALTAIWCLVALSSEAPALATWLLTVGGAVLGATESLVELRSGPVILGMCLITLIARRDWRRQVPIFVGTASVAFGLLWLAAGQSFTNLPDFVGNSAQIVSGYSEAMSTPSVSELLVPGVLAAALAITAAAALTTPAGRSRAGAAFAVGLLAFSLYKEGVVRADDPHADIIFNTAAVVCGGLAFGRRRVVAVLTMALAALAGYAAVPKRYPPNLNPVAHVQRTVDQARLLFSPARRRRVAFGRVIGMALHYKLEPQTLALLQGETVQVDPWEAAAAWVNRLDWNPLPVFQGYSAYTASLDRLNADRLRSHAGPARILRENTRLIDDRAPAIDGRVPAWDPPAATLAMLCNYVPIHATPRWQVLAKVADRCGKPQRVGVIETRFGQVATLPAARAGGILYATVRGAGISGLFERIRTLLYRARLRYAIINGSTRHRFVPGTASDGLLLDASPGADYPPPFSLSPTVRTIEFTGSSGALRLELEWMPVRPVR